jgi:hypothetical protein
MTTLAEIAAQLSEPFALEDVDFLPKGKIEKDNKTLCMALPYADPRVYQDRLNALCPGEWSTPTPTALTVGNKLVCYVTVVICGVPHSDVGEADPGENQGTEAWAQGFKRACSQATLGRYLYNLEKEWVPFNVQRKQIDLDKAGKQAIVRKMYQKAGIAVGGKPQPHVEPASNGHQEPVPATKPTSALPVDRLEPLPIDNMKQLLTRCRMRAVKLGYKTIAQYEALCQEVIHKSEPETLADVNVLNVDMMAREQKSA